MLQATSDGGRPRPRPRSATVGERESGAGFSRCERAGERLWLPSTPGQSSRLGRSLSAAAVHLRLTHRPTTAAATAAASNRRRNRVRPVDLY